jgi:hypothetical protein
MDRAVVCQWTARSIFGQRYPVECHAGDSAADAAEVLDLDVGAGRVVSEDDSEARGLARYVV